VSEPFITDDFPALWNAACDVDKHLLPVDFEEQAEAAGLIELVPVDREALESAFAWDRGIEPGGSMWRLTAKGRERYHQALDAEAPVPAHTQGTE